MVQVYETESPKTQLLRQIADDGLWWQLGSTNPNIGVGTCYSTKLISEMVNDGLLEIRLEDINIEKPVLRYYLTSKAVVELVNTYKYVASSKAALYDKPS